MFRMRKGYVIPAAQLKESLRRVLHYAEHHSAAQPQLARLVRKLNKTARSVMQRLPSQLAAKTGPAVEVPPNYAEYQTSYFDDIALEEIVLFDSFWGRNFSDNPYALYREMARDEFFGGWRFVWVGSRGRGGPEDLLEDPRVTFVANGSKEYFDVLARARVLIANSNLNPKFAKKRGQIFVNTWHGIPLKRMGFDNFSETLAGVSNTQRNFFQSDVILGDKVWINERLLCAYDADAALSSVYELGTPRIDLTIEASQLDKAKNSSQAKRRQTLLYAPTWRGSTGEISGETAMQVSVVERLLAEFGAQYDIVVSLHNYTIAQLESTPAFHGVTVLDGSTPINTTLGTVDVLVTDYSSIFYDFLVLDRPIVLYCYDLDDYASTRGFYETIEDVPAALCLTKDELVAAVRELRRPSSFEGVSQFYRELLRNEDGGASRRVVAVVREMVDRERQQGESADICTTRARNDGRIRLLFHAGILNTNGITSAFVALAKRIDKSRYDVNVVVESRRIDRSAIARQRLDDLRLAGCKIICKDRPTYVPALAKEAYDRLTHGESVGQWDDDWTACEDVFRFEERRIFGAAQFDVVVNYAGYSPWWTALLTFVNSDISVVYQHNDMKEECLRRFASLDSVFRLYHLYERVVSVSPVLEDINSSTFVPDFYSEGASTYARNLVTPKDIIDASYSLAGTGVSCDLLLTSQQFSADLTNFVAVGRLSPEKDYELMFRAFRRFIDLGGSGTLTVCGYGPLLEELSALVSELHLDGLVLLAGEVSNVYPAMRLADTLVMTSRYEGQPIVLLEALTIGLDCVGVNIPAISYTIGEYGQVVGRNVEEVAEAMLAVANGDAAASLPNFDIEEYLRAALLEFERAVS